MNEMNIKTELIRETNNIVLETSSYPKEYTFLIQKNDGKRDVIMMNNSDLGDFISVLKEHRKKIEGDE